MFALTRLGFATSVTLVIIACGQNGPASLTSPGGTLPASGSTGSGPHPTIGQLTLSGVVSETIPGGSRPLVGASVNAWVQEAALGYSYGWAHGPTYSDSAGHFRLTSLGNSTTIQLQVWKEGYVQQCASPRVAMLSDIQLDAQLVSRVTVSASPESIAPPASGFRSVSGVILEETAAGTQPVANAYVDFEPIEDFPAALTLSDTFGRYLLCGVPDGETVNVCAGFIDRVACVSAPAGQSTRVDIMLP